MEPEWMSKLGERQVEIYEKAMIGGKSDEKN
jgi:hypothetical protein